MVLSYSLVCRELCATSTTLEDALGKTLALIFLGLVMVAGLTCTVLGVKLIRNDYQISDETIGRLDKLGD